MIDLIDECGADIKNLGYEEEKSGKFSLRIGKIDVNSSDKAKATGFDEGTYFIYNCPLMHEFNNECLQYLADNIMVGLKKLMKKNSLTKKSRFLIVGLGNPNILADCLGPKVLEKISLNPFTENARLFKFAPNVFLNTGINSFDVVYMLAVWLDVDAVVVIDSLATQSVHRLTTSFQINDAGMTPGSAVNNLGQKLCKSSIGVPCLVIGVPTMLLAEKYSKDFPKDLILTPKDIHKNIDNLAIVISTALKKCVPYK